MVKAYAELVRDGVLESHHGKGFFVAEKRQVYSKAERLRRLRQAVDAFVHEAVFLDFTADEIRTGRRREAGRPGPGTQTRRSKNMISQIVGDWGRHRSARRGHPNPWTHAVLRRKCAVDTVSFSVPRGSVFAFIGRNGAGKTTTIRMILGLLEPTRGSSQHPRLRQRRPPARRPVLASVTWPRAIPSTAGCGSASMRAFNAASTITGSKTSSPAVIDYFAIDPRTKAGHLSHGQRAGLHLAMTLAIEPEVLMLDDPATGLDPAARRSLLEAMIYFTRSRERTIFFSTHLLDDVERVADHVAVLDYSVLRACAAPTRSASASAGWSCGSVPSRRTSYRPSPACCG